LHAKEQLTSEIGHISRVYAESKKNNKVNKVWKENSSRAATRPIAETQRNIRKVQKYIQQNKLRKKG
jgi:hypothetical protein